MKVYVLDVGDYGDYGIEGVYATPELAMAAYRQDHPDGGEWTQRTSTNWVVTGGRPSENADITEWTVEGA